VLLSYLQIIITLHWARVATGMYISIALMLESANLVLLKKSIVFRLLTNIFCKFLLQVVENDLVAARQTDRSLGSQDLSRYKSPP